MRLDFEGLHSCELHQHKSVHRIEKASACALGYFKTFLKRLFVEMSYKEEVLAFDLIV